MKQPFSIKLIKKLLMAMLLTLMTLSTTILVSAKEESEDIPLSVSINPPENQVEKDVGYFKLNVNPGEKQDLSVILRNSSNKNVKAQVAVNPVTTSMSGSLDYGQTFDKKTKDTSLNYPMSELLIPEKEEVVVPANGEIELKFKLAVPAEKFNGILLGGIKINQLDDDKEDKSSKKGVVINNKFAYTIGVELSEGVEVDKSELKLLGVEASQITGRNTVLAKLQHSTPKIVEDVKYEASVKKKGSSDNLHETKSSGYRIAPNSTYQYPISWENQRFEAGEYVYKLVATSEATGEKWEFEEPFTITREQANKLNEKAVDVGPDYTKWIIMGVIGVLVVIVIILVLVNVLQRNKRMKKKARRNSSSGNSSSKKGRKKKK